MKRLHKKILYSTFCALLILLSCRKFVEIDSPKSSLINATVFTSDATATSAVIDLYGQMRSGGSMDLSYNVALGADDLDLYLLNIADGQFASNNLMSDLSLLETRFWTIPYGRIFRSNSILEGLEVSQGITSAVKSRLEGEAKFFRAFEHFYLLNLFGDVPLILTTDYRINAVAPRTPKADIYIQIIKDLKDAQNLLNENYLSATGTTTTERTRVNKYAATAMLSRVYLYLNDWANAEIEASKIINYTPLYGGEVISKMFLKNSKEAIWQIGRPTLNTDETALYFGSPTTVSNAALKPSFALSFESNDLRKLNWISTKTIGANTYYTPSKYKGTNSSPVTVSEYFMVLRLGEQYLIRAEARAHQGKIIGANGAESDLNAIRNRAGLGNTSASTEATMLAAIEQERRYELFTEWGHRWLDLKRTNRSDAILGPVKGASWQTTDQLYPIPAKQLLLDPAMRDKQNPGYD